jgi:hypothetical protein
LTNSELLSASWTIHCLVLPSIIHLVVPEFQQLLDILFFPYPCAILMSRDWIVHFADSAFPSVGGCPGRDIDSLVLIYDQCHSSVASFRIFSSIGERIFHGCVLPLSQVTCIAFYSVKISVLGQKTQQSEMDHILCFMVVAAITKVMGRQIRPTWGNDMDGTSADEFCTHPKCLAQVLGTENEESCPTYKMLKIYRNIFRWTKAVEYADYYERAWINGVLCIQRGSYPGVMTYMLPLAPGWSKVVTYHGWGTKYDLFWGCYRTGIEFFSNLDNSVYNEEMEYARGSVPTLCTLLQSETRMVVEKVAACLVSIVNSFGSSVDLIDQICHRGMIEKVLHLITRTGYAEYEIDNFMVPQLDGTKNEWGPALVRPLCWPSFSMVIGGPADMELLWCWKTPWPSLHQRKTNHLIHIWHEESFSTSQTAGVWWCCSSLCPLEDELDFKKGGMSGYTGRWAAMLEYEWDVGRDCSGACS